MSLCFANDRMEHTQANYEYVKSKSKTDKADKNVLNLMESLYLEILHADEQNQNTAINDLTTMLQSDDMPNTHLLYLFMSYQSYVSHTIMEGKEVDDEYQLQLAKYIASEFETVYNVVPRIVKIYIGESLISSGYKEEAIRHFEAILSENPNTIPAKVYLFELLPEDNENKIGIWNDIQKNHLNHWMVRMHLGQ